MKLVDMVGFLRDGLSIKMRGYGAFQGQSPHLGSLSVADTCCFHLCSISVFVLLFSLEEQSSLEGWPHFCLRSHQG